MTPLVLFALFTSCGPDDSRCVGGTLESDIRYSGDLRGPGVDSEGHLAPGNYIVSTTYIKLKTDAQASKVFQEVMEGINQALPTTPGLVAFQLATSSECLSARTLSVWSNETDMGRFVLSPAHSNAIRQSGKMSRGGGGVTHWADTEAGVNFEKAARQVAAEIRPGF